jgi:hypothetical protein
VGDDVADGGGIVGADSRFAESYPVPKGVAVDFGPISELLGCIVMADELE